MTILALVVWWYWANGAAIRSGDGKDQHFSSTLQYTLDTGSKAHYLFAMSAIGN